MPKVDNASQATAIVSERTDETSTQPQGDKKMMTQPVIDMGTNQRPEKSQYECESANSHLLNDLKAQWELQSRLWKLRDNQWESKHRNILEPQENNENGGSTQSANGDIDAESKGSDEDLNAGGSSGTITDQLVSKVERLLGRKVSTKS